ncbi:MAG: ABC transporter substrate-binding protein [Oscillospiraceae bacterium]|nr:ABC transporter substrate-binding protein [Oscillospiraceae bacterium]
MKRVLAMITALLLLLGLCACDAAPSGTNESGEKIYNVGIVQLVQHVALDQATKGFQDALTEKLGDKVKFDVQLASGEPTNCTTIVTKFVNDSVDLIMANATPAVIAAKEATSTIPIIGTSVTDYVAAEAAIVASNEAPGANVTGYSDMSDIAAHVELTKKLCPDAKTVAIVYCSAEPNSVIQGDQAKKLYTEAGYTVEVMTASDVTTISTVVSAACEKADVLYIPTDNLFAENMESVKNIAEPAKVPVICGEGGMVESGGTASVAIDYYTLGYRAGEMAYEIMVNGKDPATTPIGFMSAEDMELVINEENIAALGITVPEDMK